MPYSYATDSTNATTATTGAYVSTSDVWTIWTSSTSATTANITFDVWDQWHNGTATVTYTTTDNVWNQWNDHFTADIVIRNGCHRKAMTREERDAYDKKVVQDQARYEKERIEREKRNAEEKIRRIAAEAKAKDLLMNYLSVEQREEYERHQRFHVITKAGKLYRINKGSHGNIKLIEEGAAVESLCVQPRGVPDFDSMLAQKLWLETDEEQIRKVANITDYRNRGFRRAM